MRPDGGAFVAGNAGMAAIAGMLGIAGILVPMSAVVVTMRPSLGTIAKLYGRTNSFECGSAEDQRSRRPSVANSAIPPGVSFARIPRVNLETILPFGRRAI